MKKPTFRAATLDDAALAADIMTAAFPREPEDPVMTRERWKHGREDFIWGRFIAEVDGVPAGYVEWAHGPWEQLPERHCYVDVFLDLSYMSKNLLKQLWKWLEEEAAKQGAWTLNASAGEEESRQELAGSRQGRGADQDRDGRDFECPEPGVAVSGDAQRVPEITERRDDERGSGPGEPAGRGQGQHARERQGERGEQDR